MYKSERHFSHALVNILRANKFVVQRIESPETGTGIPDMWLSSIRCKDKWVELKNMPMVSVYDNYWTIPWRKGQQAWAYQYRKVMNRHTYTVCALKDGFIVIPMVKTYPKNVVRQSECIRMTSITDIIGVLSE